MHNLPYDAVLFDLDGTLTRSGEGILSSFRYTLERMNAPIPTDEEMKQFVGPPLRETLKNMVGFSDEQVDEAIPHFVSHQDREGIQLYSVYPYIRTLLSMLKQNGVYIAVATSKPIRRAMNVLNLYQLTDYFDCIIGEGGNDHQVGKAELIQKALPQKYRKAVMVGDRYYDIDGAKANQMDSIGAGYGYAVEGELEKAGADYIVNTVEELASILCPGCECPKGYFVTMEGLDGSGKTTQLDSLAKKLKQYGYDVLQTREPGGCPISENIRNLLLTTDNIEMSAACEALLYAASRAQHVQQVIRPAVEDGKLVLCDRFVDSSIAYQGGGRELGTDAVADINAFAVEGTYPDITVYLEIDHLTALQRRHTASTPDRLEIEPSAFHERVQKAYEKLIASEPKRFVVVDAAKNIEDLADDILQTVVSRLISLEQ